MRKRLKKNMSIDDLAVIVQRGFENTATKDDIADMATKKDLTGVAMKKDIEDLRNELGNKLEGINRRLDAMADYNRRIARIERLVDGLVAR